MTLKEISVHFIETESCLKKVIQNQMKSSGYTQKNSAQKDKILNLLMTVLLQMIAFKEVLVIAG
jgi:hypothetical protein